MNRSQGAWYQANIATGSVSKRSQTEFGADPRPIASQESILAKLKLVSPEGKVTPLGMAVGVAIVAGVGYTIYNMIEKRNLEMYGPRNLRQLGRSYRGSRMQPRLEGGMYSEYGGRPLNTRQLARLGLI